MGIPSLVSEWGVNQARDTYASYIGHYPMLAYFAVAENESIARVKFNIAEVLRIQRYSRLLSIT